MRMGVHLQNINASVEAMVIQYLDLVKPPWMKVLDGAVSARVIEAARRNGTKIVGRKHFDEHEQAIDNDGKHSIAKIVEYARSHPEFDAIEGYNECYDNPGEIGRYGAWCIDLMKALEAIGRKAAIGSFSTGTPEPDEWVEFLPALKHAWDNGHYISLHEYGGGPGGMRWGAGRNQWNNGRPVSDDPAEGADVVGWWCLRYRKFLLPLLKARGLGARILITESGLDNITPRLGGQGNGWRDFMTAAEYARETIWYGKHLTIDSATTSTGRPVATDSGIHGWVGFGDGSRRANGDKRWWQFDILEEGDSAVIGRKQLELPRAPGSPAPPPPAPTPPPAPPAPTPVPPIHNIYAVARADEQLYALVRRVFNLPPGVERDAAVAAAVRAVKTANGWTTTPRLAPGQVVIIPGWATMEDING